jgi:hypothetical protein
VGLLVVGLREGMRLGEELGVRLGEVVGALVVGLLVGTSVPPWQPQRSMRGMEHVSGDAFAIDPQATGPKSQGSSDVQFEHPVP